MTDPNFSAIRARLRYESLDAFMAGYVRFISKGGMFIPMTPSKLKPVGTTIRFQFLLQDGTVAMLGEGVVRQIQGTDDDAAKVGMLVKFTKLSRDTKKLVDAIVARKPAASGNELAPSSTELGSTDDASPPPSSDATNEPDDSGLFDPDADPDVADDAATRDARDGNEIVEPADPPEPPEDAPNPAAPPEQTASLAGDDSSPASALPADLGVTGSDLFDDDPEFASDGPASDGPASDGPASDAAMDDADSAAEPDGAQGSNEIGRTEAGLQIKAFDDASKAQMEDFDGFDFDGAEDDVDQMFDGIFGGGADDDEELDLFAGSLHDGGQPVDTDETDLETTDDHDAADQPDIDQPDIDQSAAAGPAQATGDLGDQPSAVDPPSGADDDSEPVVELTDLIPDDEPNSDANSDPGAAPDATPVEQPPPDQEPVAADAPVAADTPVAADAPADDRASLADSSSAAVDDTAEDPIQDNQGPAGDAVDDHRESGEMSDEFAPTHTPSNDTLSALGALDDDAAPSMEIALGVDNESQDVDDGEEDDDESLESLLAVAQKDIDAKQTSDDDGDSGDIIDDLIGEDDDLPPRPANEPVFDINDEDGKKKKKKGGFISKLFGKD